MSVIDYLKKNRKNIKKKYLENNSKRNNLPNDLYRKCPECNQAFQTKEIELNSFECTKCGHHFRISAYERIHMIVDNNSFKEWNFSKRSKNPLNFKSYTEKLRKLKKATGLNDAVVTGIGLINGNSCVVCALDPFYLMGSMGTVVGEKLTYAIEKATKHKLPLIIFSASGGARMQEGIFSLMQMAKTSAALKKHDDKNLLFISVLTHPTTGGVTASFASLGDIILAEPNALIGFAGPRVIEQTINQKLPNGFQRSEFLLEKGFIDKIVKRSEMRNIISNILDIHVGV